MTLSKLIEDLQTLEARGKGDSTVVVISPETRYLNIKLLVTTDTDDSPVILIVE